MRPLPALLAALLLTAAPNVGAAIGAQPAPAAVGYVVLRGADTVAVERAVRTAGRVTGEMVVTAQGGLRQTYTMTLGAAGSVSAMELAVFAPGAPSGAEPLQRATIQLDSAGATVTAGGQPQRIDAPPGAMPFINLSSPVLEQLVRRARALGGDSVQIPVVAVGAPRPLVATITRRGGDTVSIVLGVEMLARVDATGALLGAVVPAQDVRFARVAGDALSLDVAAPDYSAPGGAPYTAEDVQVPNTAAGITLAGTLTVPQHAAGTRVAAVVLITGSGPEDRDGGSSALPGWRPFRAIADTLGRRGIAVLRIDDRGVGGSQLGSLSATTEDFAGDVRAALAWLRARPEIDPARLVLLGHSEGGMIAPMVAATDSALRAIVLVAAPARSGRVVSDAQIASAMAQQGITGARRDSLLRLNDRARDSLASATPWLDFFLRYDPLPTARRVRQPTLIVQGATDTQVSPEQATELATAMRAAGNRDVTVRVVPAMNHLLVADSTGVVGVPAYRALPSMDVRRDFLGIVADWLAAHLR